MFVIKEDFDAKYLKEIKELFTEENKDFVDIEQLNTYKQKIEEFVKLRKSRYVSSRLFENGIALLLRLHCYKNGEGERLFLMIKANKVARTLLTFELDEIDLLLRNWITKTEIERNYLLFVLERFCIPKDKVPKPQKVLNVGQQYWFSPIM